MSPPTGAAGREKKYGATRVGHVHRPTPTRVHHGATPSIVITSGPPLPSAHAGAELEPAAVLHVVGARPNFVKMAPLIDALARRGDVRQLVVHTGQHYDRRMSDEILDDLGFPAPDFSLGVGSGTHGEQTGKVLIAFERILLERPPRRWWSSPAT